MRYFVSLGAREIAVDVTALSGGGFDVRVDGKPVSVDAVPAGGALSLLIEGNVVDLVLDASSPRPMFASFAASGRAAIENERTRSSSGARGPGASKASQEFVVAPMPGRIVRVLVSPGASVEPGTPLIVIEAMKMENELRANQAGTVAEIIALPGDAVDSGAKLIRFA